MDHTRSDVEMAKRFEALVAKDKRFEIEVLKRFALVLLRDRIKASFPGPRIDP